MTNPSRDNLDTLISGFARSLPDNTRVLDAGSANGPYKSHFDHCRYETSDIGSNVTYQCDICAMPMPDDFFDAIICTQVLEHIKTPHKAIDEIFRVLKPGGRLLLTTPFFYEEHLIPYDYFRFTQFGLKSLFEASGFVIDKKDWLEGFSCATFYFMETLLKELRKLPDSDPVHELESDIEKLSTAFLEREVKAPIYNVGFPKNYVYYCTKPARNSKLVGIIDHVIKDRLTYLSTASMNGIVRCIEDVELKKIPGDLCEFGVALGGSALVIASSLANKRRFYGFDVFGMIPPPGPDDDPQSHERYDTISGGKSKGIAGDVYYGYREDIFEFVKSKFDEYDLAIDGDRINLVKGEFSETLPKIADITTIAVSHIDCDWYTSVIETLRFSAAHMAVGGYIIVDDFNAWGGARRATLEFLQENNNYDIVVARPHAILKKMRSEAA